MTHVENLDKLLPEEREEISLIVKLWKSRRESGDYQTADYFRSLFSFWDTQTRNDGLWYPQFEHPLNRQRRAFNRMKKYGVDVYPWTRAALDK